MAARRAQEIARLTAAARQAAAEARAKSIEDLAVRKLAMADSLRQEGFVRQAVSRYLRMVTGSSKRTAAGRTARMRLDELRTEGESKLGEIKESLTEYNLTTGRTNKLTEDEVRAKLGEFRKLSRDFEKVPGIGNRLQTAYATTKRKARFAAVLNEPATVNLVTQAKKHEQGGQICCAFLFYEEAAKLTPAKSAYLARERLDRMNADPKIVAAAKKCSELQWCHKTFNWTDRLTKLKPKVARDLFADISRRAPTDSEIYRLARVRYEELNSQVN